jgi:cellulose synthase/poly-beta-1,6-N-acetylglucosamine synthase-like glycosyltransferase
VRTIYHSRTYPNLRVVDKERGGTADALNVGINASRFRCSSYLIRAGRCAATGGSWWSRSSTTRTPSPLQHHTRDARGELTESAEPELPDTLFARLQVVEHLREPVFCRLGWARLNATLGIADAAILFRKDAVVDAGGFRAEMIAEEMEVIARLHLVQRSRGERYRIHVVPEPICRVPAAPTLGKLREERMRWQVALAQTLARNRALVREHGFAARFAFPFFLIFECYGPAIEIAAYVLMTVMFALGLVPGMALAAFLALVFSMGFMVSMSTLLLEDMSFRLYPRWGQAARLTIAAIVENLGYRQLVALWRFDALMRWWQQPR